MAPLLISNADFALIPMLETYHSYARNVSFPEHDTWHRQRKSQLAWC